MTADELRQKYLDFFRSKDHAIIPSASLVPEHDPTVLFTTAGMHPLVPYLMGEPHPEGRRLADAQKCVRTGDIDEVGDNRHLTFFEMLGNWSLGDYFKEEAIAWSWEFMTGADWLNLDPRRIYVTVFKGDENGAMDQVSIDAWKKQFNTAGMKAEVCPYGELAAGNPDYRIFPLPAEDNWWGPAGQTGPCGPCTEMFYDVAPEKGPMRRTFAEEVDAFRIMEFWNDVFMEFNKTAPGKFEKLKQKNVDTGMGLERTVAILSGHTDAFASELFTPIFKKIEELSGKKYGASGEITRAMRIIADHLKAAVFIMGDDKSVAPSNVDQGYIVRRLIRRAVRYAKMIGIKEAHFTPPITEMVIRMYENTYTELTKNLNFIIDHLVKEEQKFSLTLERGLKRFKNLDLRFKNTGGVMPGKEVFDLYQTYGFPVEMTEELARENKVNIDRAGFEEELKRHQDLSRTAAAGKFKGGLADAGEETRKLHTAAHLLLAALRKVLGDHVVQKGSNITAERLRFDFSHPDKLTDEQKQEVERLVNEAIASDLPVSQEEMPLEEAKKRGAMGVFESKYGEKVRVYTVGADGNVFSREICGGPHAERTGVLGKFRIKKEESSSAGVRRIKAVLEDGDN